MKPIVYDRREVALMVKVGAFFDPKFARSTGESSVRIHRMATGRIKPSASILNRFNLQEKEGSYEWHAQ